MNELFGGPLGGLVSGVGLRLFNTYLESRNRQWAKEDADASERRGIGAAGKDYGETNPTFHLFKRIVAMSVFFAALAMSFGLLLFPEWNSVLTKSYGKFLFFGGKESPALLFNQFVLTGGYTVLSYYLTGLTRGSSGSLTGK